MFSHGSRARLTEKDLDRFSGGTLFARVGRALCHARCLPRKELYEAWEVARRCRRLFRGGRVVEMGAGHGLLAHLMLLLDDTSRSALAVDIASPLSATKVQAVLAEVWPRLSGRVQRVDAPVDAIGLRSGDLVVSIHACGALTDAVIGRAVAARARLAVLPCCHDLETCEAGRLTGWLDAPLAIDVGRAGRLERQGYRIWTQTIPATITPKNRLLLAAPDAPATGPPGFPLQMEEGARGRR
jgi:hypothetical protein